VTLVKSIADKQTDVDQLLRNVVFGARQLTKCHYSSVYLLDHTTAEQSVSPSRHIHVLHTSTMTFCQLTRQIRSDYSELSYLTAYYYAASPYYARRMRPIVTDRVGRSVCRSVCHDREPCKNGWTDPEAVWGMNSGGPMKVCIRWGAHWRHLANTIEPSMCDGDSAFLSNYFDYLLFYCQEAKCWYCITKRSIFQFFVLLIVVGYC